MSALPASLVELASGTPLAHLSTTNADGSPQVSVVWLALEDGDLVTAHLGRYAKLRNIERDPRVVLSFEAPRTPGEFMTPYAVAHAHATIEPRDDAWDVLDAMAKRYIGPDATFPAPRGPGFVIRYAVDKVAGVGPWAGWESPNPASRPV